MISNLCKNIVSYCCCFKQQNTNTFDDNPDNVVYNIFENDIIVTNEKLHRTSTSVDNNYSLSNEAFNYSDIYR